MANSGQMEVKERVNRGQIEGKFWENFRANSGKLLGKILEITKINFIKLRIISIKEKVSVY